MAYSVRGSLRKSVASSLKKNQLQMKNLLLTLCVLSSVYLSAGVQAAQKREVPAVVLNAFQQKFPNARDVEWARTRDGNYEVEFDNGIFGRDSDALISPEGKVLRHEEDITAGALPDAVKEKIRAKFDGYRVDNAKKVDTGGTITYEVELESRHGDMDVVFAADGAIVKERID